MKKTFLLAIFAAVFVLSASAQSRVSFGARAGINVDHQLYINNGITTLPDNQLGFHVGAVSDIRLFADLYLEPGLMFTTKGSSTTLTGQGISHERLYYMEMPLLLSYFFTVIPDALGISLNVGPFAALGLWGNSIDYVGEKSSAFSNNGLRRFDAGVHFGGGLEFHQVYLGISYDVGLHDVAQSKNPIGSIKNRAIMISTGYNF
jgi:hypothetical protein